MNKQKGGWVAVENGYMWRWNWKRLAWLFLLLRASDSYPSARPPFPYLHFPCSSPYFYLLALYTFDLLLRPSVRPSLPTSYTLLFPTYSIFHLLYLAYIYVHFIVSTLSTLYRTYLIYCEKVPSTSRIVSTSICVLSTSIPIASAFFAFYFLRFLLSSPSTDSYSIYFSHFLASLPHNPRTDMFPYHHLTFFTTYLHMTPSHDPRTAMFPCHRSTVAWNPPHDPKKPVLESF